MPQPAGAEVNPRARIGIDGFALGLERGTGVTSYSLNLSHALRDLGAAIGVLYGGMIGNGPDPIVREVV